MVASSARDIVVTGAGGFLGRAVIEQLALLELPATGVTRRAIPGMRQVADYADTPAASVIVHLAEEPDRALANQLGDAYADGTASITRTLVSRSDMVVYASSGVVYGDDNEEPCTPRTRLRDSDTYSRSKIHNELVVLDAGGTAMRLANLFGTGMSQANVVSDISRQLGTTGPLRVRDDTPVRDFLYIRDAARAIALAVTARCCGIYNVGSGHGLSVRQLAEVALAATDQFGREIVVSQPSSRRSVIILDIADTRHRLGWTPARSSTEQLAAFFRLGAGLGS